MIKKIGLFALTMTVSLIFSGCSSTVQNSNQTNSPVPTINGGEKAVVYFFWGEGCPHCTAQKPFLEEMKNKYPGLIVKDYETWKNQDNAAIFQEMAAAFGTRAQGVPTTFIGDGEPFVGFSDNMKADMENRIKVCVAQGCTDPGTKL